MARLNLLRTIFVILLILAVQPIYAQDELGVFFDADGTINTITTTTPYSQVSAWVQLVDPTATEAVTAFEFRLEVHTDGPDPILIWNLPEQAINIEEEPVFMVGLGTPLLIEPRITLAEVVILVPEAGQTVWLTLHPLNEPSLLDPPGYGYPVCKPVYAVGPENDMLSLTVNNGCDSDPVASINPDGNPPEIQVGGMPASLTLQKDAQGKQIEHVTLVNHGDVSFSGVAYVSGTTPIQFEIDGKYYTDGPVYFQVPVGGSTRITPAYNGGGSVDATIELEICDNQWSIPVGSQGGWANCAWSVDTLVFGEIELGQSQILNVELTNTGYEPLPVTNYFAPHFTLYKIQHFGDVLAIGDSCTYRVTFTPTMVGEISESVTIGAQICSLNLSGTCLDGPPVCLVSQTALNFPDFIVGSNSQLKSFTIRNTGGGTLEGFVTLNDASGFFQLGNYNAGSFALANSESKTITVIFNPQEGGVYSSEIDLGLECENVSLTGEAIVLDPQCFVSASSLNFSEFIVGANPQYQYFLIRNTGGGILQGTVSLNDSTGAFHLQNYGGGQFFLGPNDGWTVAVSFDPSEAGEYLAEINLGLECGPVSLVGHAIELPPQCEVNATSLNFPEFVMGQLPQNHYVRIKNVGGGLLEGSAVVSDPTGAFYLGNYSGNSYSLAYNQSTYVRVCFFPSEAGQYFAQLDPGSGCGNISLSGNAVDLPPECQVSITQVDFNEHIVGGYVQSIYFVLKNIGGGLLEGTIALADTTTGFQLNNWNGDTFSLSYLQSQYVQVEFDPEVAGSFSTTVELGTDCESIPVSGAAIEVAPECEMVGSNLEDGVLTIYPIPVGGHSSGYLGIRNLGGGFLEGQVTLDSSGGPFQLLGNGDYSLHNGEGTYFEIEFTPTEVGQASVLVHAGELCGDITVVGVGEESYADCRSYFYNYNFERVAVGDTATGYIYLRNNGYLDLEGNLQVDGEGFQLENPGPFNLPVGEVRYEEIWFIPETAGDFAATVSTGLSLCPGEWEIEGSSVPAGSDRMGLYFDSEGLVSHVDTDVLKVRETAYLVLNNPSAEGQMIQWYVNFWSNGSVIVVDDWNSYLPGDFQENSYRKRLYLESPMPYSENMVLADFSILILDPDEACEVNVGYAFYKTLTDSGTDYVVIRDPGGLQINSSKSDLKSLPPAPVGLLAEEKVILEWPCGPLNFEGFNIYRRVNDEDPEKLTIEPVVFTDGEARYEDTDLPEDAFEVHYFVTSFFKGIESPFGPEVTLVLEAQENEIPSPTHTRLLAIYPNPFNPETNISFDIAQPSRVQIKIYDVGGRLVRSLTDQHFESGHYEETWNGRDDAGRSLPSNVYYARMVAGSVVQLRKMTLLK